MFCGAKILSICHVLNFVSKKINLIIGSEDCNLYCFLKVFDACLLLPTYLSQILDITLSIYMFIFSIKSLTLLFLVGYHAKGDLCHCNTSSYHLFEVNQISFVRFKHSPPDGLNRRKHNVIIQQILSNDVYDTSRIKRIVR